jgi:hypothetical protein
VRASTGARSRDPRKKMDESSQAEEKIYVALPERWKDGKNTLSWVLNHFPNDAKIIITHVHIPAQMIPMSKHQALLPFHIFF